MGPSRALQATPEVHASVSRAGQGSDGPARLSGTYAIRKNASAQAGAPFGAEPAKPDDTDAKNTSYYFLLAGVA